MLKNWKDEKSIVQFLAYVRSRTVQNSLLQPESENRNDLTSESDAINNSLSMFYPISLDWNSNKKYVKTHILTIDEVGSDRTLT